MAGPLWLFADDTSAFVANRVHNCFPLPANNHVRHVKVTGNVTFTPYPTNVLGDNGVWMGVQAVAPAVAPGAPGVGNAGNWVTTWWGRPPVTACELVYEIGGSTIPSVRYWFDIEFDTAIDMGAVGALYVGHQAIYVDANHALPNVSYSCVATGFTT